MCLDAPKPTDVVELPDSLTWQQISTACKDGRKLMVVNEEVYDVAEWVQKHPGGKVLLTYVGEDATDSVRAFHRDEQQMAKYLSPLRIATLSKQVQGDPVHELVASRDAALEKDFRDLRKKLEEAGLFKANPWFYMALLAHVIVLELAGWAVLKHFGSSWLPYCIAVAPLVAAQAQAG